MASRPPDRNARKSKNKQWAYVLYICLVFSVMIYLIRLSIKPSSDWEGIGFLIAFLVVGAIYIGPLMFSVALGYFIKYKLTQKGYCKKVSTGVGLLTTLTILYIPFWDYPYKRILVNDYCEKEAGFHISKTVSGVEGVFGLENAVDYGYQYGETYYPESQGKASLRRIYNVKTANGSVLEIESDSLSPYGFRESRARVVSTIYRDEMQTYVTATGEVLGRYDSFVNLPNGKNSDAPHALSLNDFRPWMRMSCQNAKTERENLAELLKKTLQPAIL